MIPKVEQFISTYATLAEDYYLLPVALWQACLFEEQSRVLRDALEVLTPEERRAIETAFFSELSHEQTARALREPLGTVKTRIRSGLGKLREVLKGI